MEFVFISLACLILLLVVIWRPFFKQGSEKKSEHSLNLNLREQTNIELYLEHKREIEQDYSRGAIDQENYQYLLSELDKSLLQDIEANESQRKVATSVEEVKGFNLFVPLSLSVFVLVFSLALYMQQETFQQLTQPAIANTQHQGMSQEQAQQQRRQQALTYIKQLQEYTQDKPDDSKAWYNLGQALISVGDFDGAIVAIDHVIRLEGEHADLVGEKAQASYYGNNQQIDKNVQQLIDRALSLDPADPATNILLGMHNFLASNFKQAIHHWQVVIDSKKQGVNIAALQEAITEANKRLATVKKVKNTDTGPQLTIDVSLSKAIASKLAQGEDKVVFVYAIPVSGQRLPLAAVKVMTSDLPTKIVLNNQQGMTPQSNLSSVDKVHLYAVVSNQGGAGIKIGDYKAELRNVDVNSVKTQRLFIDKIVE